VPTNHEIDGLSSCTGFSYALVGGRKFAVSVLQQHLSIGELSYQLSQAGPLTGRSQPAPVSRDSLPRGLLPIGDAFCRFNPIYGQGLSSAVALRAAQKSGLRHLPCKLGDGCHPWAMAPSIQPGRAPAVADDFRNVKKMDHWAFDADVLFVGAEQVDVGWLVSAIGEGDQRCPDSGERLKSRHSWHNRRLQDLPVQGERVALKLRLAR
jgi:hypothetical protein